MPDEPNKNVEEQLKSWAKTRRGEASAPFELHPATRRLLQDEVARTFAKPGAEQPAVKGAWWKLLWPRLAVAGSICALLVILFGLSGPTLFKAKSKTERIAAFNQLMQIGIAARIYAGDHDGRLPATLEQMRDELGGAVADKLVKDPESGKNFVYLGAGKIEGDHGSILAYSPTPRGRRPVLLGDGHVEEMDETQFNDALQRTLKVETTIALAATTRVVPLAENTPTEREVLAPAESKDTPLKSAEQPAKLEARQNSEKRAPSELASNDKRKEIAGAPVGTATITRGMNVENERSEVLLRERYGLTRSQAGAVTARTETLADGQKFPGAPRTSPVAAPQVASDGAKAGQNVAGISEDGVGGGLAGKPASATNVASSLAQNGATTNEYALTVARQSRQFTDRSAWLAERRETDRLGTSNLYPYAAGVAPTQASQRFAQIPKYRSNFNSPPVPNVLQSFLVEQTGQQIRLVDADGSVYDGAIEPPPTEETQVALGKPASAPDLKKDIEAKRVQSASALSAGEMAASQNVFFRVAGTNRTLNQLLVFQGNFLADTNQTSVMVRGAPLNFNQAATPSLQQTEWLQRQSQRANALIRGQATIGASNRIEIDAAPAGP